MKIRLSGTDTECADAITALATTFTIREVSSFYPNRGASVLGRVYVDAEPLGDGGRIRATATSAESETLELPAGRRTIDRVGGRPSPREGEQRR